MSLGADLVVVGQGKVEHAKQFASDQSLPYRLFTDPTLRAYEAAGLKRGGQGLGGLGLSTFTRAARLVTKGLRQGATQGDAFQQGGAFIIAPDQTVWHSQVSDYAGDHVDPQLLLQVLRSRL